MTDLLAVNCSKASSCDRAENTTYGWVVEVQIGPFVLSWFMTARPFWRKNA